MAQLMAAIRPCMTRTRSKLQPAPRPRPDHRNRKTEVDFKGAQRSTATHALITDPEARPYKKTPARVRCSASSVEEVRKRSGRPFSRQRP